MIIIQQALYRVRTGEIQRAGCPVEITNDTVAWIIDFACQRCTKDGIGAVNQDGDDHFSFRAAIEWNGEKLERRECVVVIYKRVPFSSCSIAENAI